MSAPLRLAMWSGPRNISTAMLRAWENRADTVVVDEPLYGFYLERTGLPHPGAAEVVAHEETDWRRVAERLTGPLPPGARIFYQKHMAHHLLPEVERDWLWGLAHAFLVRDPREMLLSLAKVTPQPSAEDTGLPQQQALFDQLRERTGRTPPVLDARDVLGDPRALLTRLCSAVGVAFDEAMLSWPAGPRDSDGCWAPHWYAAVEGSTGFQSWSPRDGELTAELEAVRAECQPIYDALFAQRLTA